MIHAKLTPKQEAFAQHHAINGNATAALKSAGYRTASAKPETTHRRAIEVLQNPKVAARIEELSQRIKERAENVFDITADRILQELAAIAFANLQDFIRIDANGQPQPALDNAKRHQWAALSELTIEETRTGRRTKFKLLDKKGALIELGKFTGLLCEKSNTEAEEMRAAINAAAADLLANVDHLIERAEKEAAEEDITQDGRGRMPWPN